MKVAVLYSGGKDSTLAIEYCMKNKWEIEYLLSVKPSRRDCYLFHYATVEHTKELAKILGIKHILVDCNVSDPKKEAKIIREVVEKNIVDAVVLGGVGLQVTQLKSIQDALLPLRIEVFASHAGLDEEFMLERMIKEGYEVIITEIASDGLDEKWLGRKLDKQSLAELKKLSIKYGFNLLGEGGYYNSLVVSGPIFKKRLEIIDSEKVMEDEFSGYLKINKVKISDKKLAVSEKI